MYNRIWITPSRIDFGVVLVEQEEEFIVWNAYLAEDKTCTSIDEVNLSEITLSGLTTPFTLKALAMTEYTVTVGLEGSASFVTTLTFNFGEPVEQWIDLVASRSLVIPFRPQSPVSEQLGWKTDILTAANGDEQRMCLRKAPRQSYKLDYLLSEQEMVRLETILFKFLKGFVGVPVWTEFVAHSGVINLGDLSITVDTTYADFRDTDYAIIWVSADNNEVVSISTATPTTLNLSTAVSGSFSGNKLIIPIRICSAKEAVSEKYSNGLSRASLRFDCIDNIEITDYSAPELLNSIPVISDPTYVDKLHPGISDADKFYADFGVGKFNIHSDSKWNKDSQNQLFHNETKQESWEFRQFLHYLKGRQKTYYVPTFLDDFVLTEQIDAVGTNFKAENLLRNRYVGVSAIWEYLYFDYLDGTHAIRKITGITHISDSVEEIELDSTLGKVIDPGEIRISFLKLCRLQNDNVLLNWERAWESDCQFAIVGVEN
ncbi:MAG: hypothetical protein DRP56_08860 [Planctomycetota bacterium]|nr:MAG: hypothetical protein DRP56_08860 [Planctomycetota bacterium]